MALGLGSLFNHSTDDQNVGWVRDTASQCITYRALRDISPGEELCINYGRLWFTDADVNRKRLKEEEPDDENTLNRIDIDT